VVNIYPAALFLAEITMKGSCCGTTWLQVSRRQVSPGTWIWHEPLFNAVVLTTDSEAVERIAKAVVAEYLSEDVEDSAKATVEFFTDAYFLSKNVSVANQCSRMYSTLNSEFIIHTCGWIAE